MLIKLFSFEIQGGGVYLISLSASGHSQLLEQPAGHSPVLSVVGFRSHEGVSVRAHAPPASVHHDSVMSEQLFAPAFHPPPAPVQAPSSVMPVHVPTPVAGPEQLGSTVSHMVSCSLQLLMLLPPS